MKYYYVKSSFLMYTDSDLETKAGNVVTNFKNNKAFVNPVPAVTVVEDALARYSEAVKAAIDGGRAAVAAKNQARKALEGMLRQWANYANMIAAGDLSILAACGLDVAKERGSSTPLTTPQIVKVASGKNPGEVEVTVTCTGAQNYIYEYTADPLTDTSVWGQDVSRLKKHLITGLKPVSKVWLRVTARGSRDSKATSNIVSYHVQ